MTKRKTASAIIGFILVLLLIIGAMALYQWSQLDNDSNAPPAGGQNTATGALSSDRPIPEELERDIVENAIRENINTLSPIDPVLGGTFRVTDITWEEDAIIVEYEDGHIALIGEAQYEIDGSDVIITEFEAEQL